MEVNSISRRRAEMKTGDSGPESVSAGLVIVLPPMMGKIVVTSE